MTNSVLGMDIGGTNMRFGLVDEQYGLSGFFIRSTRTVLNGEHSSERLEAAVREYCVEHLHGVLPRAVSIGFPSSIDATRRIIRSTPNVKGLDNLPVVDLLEEALGIPVFIHKDANFLLLFDMYDHRVDENAVILGCYAGTGFGNAISSGGRLLLGKNGVAAELGHIPVLGQTVMCGCGNAGCVEAFASGVYLEKLQAEHFPDTPIGELFVRHADDARLAQFVDYLSVPIATEANIFDPDYVIIGGGLVQMQGFPVQKLEQCIRAHARKPYPSENLVLLYSSPGQENGVIGAGIYAYKRLADSTYR